MSKEKFRFSKYFLNLEFNEKSVEILENDFGKRKLVLNHRGGEKVKNSIEFEFDNEDLMFEFFEENLGENYSDFGKSASSLYNLIQIMKPL